MITKLKSAWRVRDYEKGKHGEPHYSEVRFGFPQNDPVAEAEAYQKAMEVERKIIINQKKRRKK